MMAEESEKFELDDAGNMIVKQNAVHWLLAQFLESEIGGNAEVANYQIEDIQKKLQAGEMSFVCGNGIYVTVGTRCAHLRMFVGDPACIEVETDYLLDLLAKWRDFALAQEASHHNATPRR